MSGVTSKELAYQRFVQRELGLSHPTYDSELSFYNNVKNGDIEALIKLKSEGIFQSVDLPERGKLSDDKIRNLKYHIIVTVSMICRFCIEGGLDERDSYGLSDIYINRIDKAATVKQLFELHEQVIFDYAERMKRLNKTKRLNLHCIKAMEYISDNLHRPLSVTEVAEHMGIDRTYLGKLFKSETGQTVLQYIRSKKIQTAQNMLVYSELSCSEISEYLGFASQSHFTENFKKVAGITPSEYKAKYYRKHWDDR